MNTKEVIGGLEFTDQITAPDHEYLQRSYHPELAIAFNAFAGSCVDYFSSLPDYPNAVMRVEPLPVYIEPGNISFMMAWGNATEHGLPRTDMIPKYFNRRTRAIARERQLAVTLDGYGFVGRVCLKADTPTLTTAIGVANSEGKQYASHMIATPEQADLAVVETAASVKVGRALRLHEAIAWHPYNGYIWCETFDDDESRVLGKI